LNFLLIFVVLILAQKAYEGDVAMCEYLLCAGVSVQAREKGGQSALMRACKAGHLEVAQLLYRHGAAPDVSVADSAHQTPLHVACAGGHDKVVAWLCATPEGQGLKALQCQTIRGATPVGLAAKHAHVALCQKLILRGALDAPNGHVDATKVHNLDFLQMLLVYSWCVASLQRAIECRSLHQLVEFSICLICCP